MVRIPTWARRPQEAGDWLPPPATVLADGAPGGSSHAEAAEFVAGGGAPEPCPDLLRSGSLSACCPADALSPWLRLSALRRYGRRHRRLRRSPAARRLHCYRTPAASADRPHRSVNPDASAGCRLWHPVAHHPVAGLDCVRPGSLAVWTLPPSSDDEFPNSERRVVVPAPDVAVGRRRPARDAPARDAYRNR